ncbi:MAG: TetR/AcrR family transcriptional regulator [Salibacteraceae bacterium]
MEKMDKKAEQLLEGALQVFMKFGIRSVTMDDMARHLGVSKKTLYKYFKDKKDLVLKGMEFHQMNEQCAMEECFVDGINAIDENFAISQIIMDQIQNIHPSVMYDLEKYYPETQAKFDEYKKTVVKSWVESNIERGIQQGLFRDDLNIPILSAMYLQRMDAMMRSEDYPADVSLAEVYVEIFRYHIRGLASEKGVEYLKQKMKKEQ